MIIDYLTPNKSMANKMDTYHSVFDGKGISSDEQVGQIYEAYGKNPYNPNELAKRLNELYDDPSIHNRKGIWEYLLGGESDKRLLDIRMFDEKTKQLAYNKQKQKAQEKNISNCPLCAIGDNANKTKIWALKEMEADHVTAWSKGGLTGIENCEMLCVMHNRMKGNR